MASIKGKGTEPERMVARMLRQLRIRYRGHSMSQAGRPDFVLVESKKVIFVHGCFWHHHLSCAAGRYPKSNAKFWKKKLSGNVTRDKRVIERLRRNGFKVTVVWECELKKPKKLLRRLQRFSYGCPSRRFQPESTLGVLRVRA